MTDLKPGQRYHVVFFTGNGMLKEDIACVHLVAKTREDARNEALIKGDYRVEV